MLALGQIENVGAAKVTASQPLVYRIVSCAAVEPFPRTPISVIRELSRGLGETIACLRRDSRG